MVEAVERRVEANGLSHHVITWNGEGSPSIVLCHGFLDTAFSFEPLAERLAAAGARVVAFDWRGHGETDRVGAGGYYHFPDYVLDLHALMPQLATGEAHLVGHSMGGTAAALYAATHPAALRTLTLVEGLGPPAFEGEAIDKVVAWLESVDRLRARTPVPMRDLAEAVKRLRAQTPELPEALARRLAERATTDAPEGGRVWRFDPLHRTTAPMPFSAEAFSTFLARIDAPVLIVSGSRGFRTVDHAARVAALKAAREIEIEGVGHMIHWLAPGALAEAVLAHVRRR